MILIKESVINRIAKHQEWNDRTDVNHHVLRKKRTRKEVPHYYGRPIGAKANNGYYHDMRDLEKLFGVKFELEGVYSDYYAEVKNPTREGFTRIPKGKELSDVVSSASQQPSWDQLYLLIYP